MRSNLKYYGTIANQLYEFTPADANFQVQFDRENTNRVSYTGSMKQRVTFHVKQDFELLLKQEQGSNRCVAIPIEIRRTCNGAEKIEGNAILNLSDGEWDLSHCNMAVELRMLDPYQCYEDNKGGDENFFDAAPTRFTAKLLKGTLQFVSYSSAGYGTDQWNASHFPESSPQTKGWVWYKFEYAVVGNTSTYYYVREVVPNGPLVTPDMTAISGTNFARPPQLYNFRIIGSSGSRPPRNGAAATALLPFEYDIFGNTGQAQSIDNGMALGDILSYYFNKYCGVTVVSDFFQINPETPSSVNYVTGTTSRVNNILLFNKSDVKRPGVSSNATIATFQLGELVESLCNAFNCRYRIANGVFRIEHVSHSIFRRQVELDVTTSDYELHLSGKKVYTYDNSRLPRREVFSWMEVQNPDFAGVPISYVGACVTADLSAVDAKIEVSKITTDLSFVMANSDSESNLVSDEGLFMLATEIIDGNYYPVVDAPILDTQARHNNHLGWAQLHNNYFRHDRYQPYGYLNNVYTTFISSKPIKKGVAFTIPFGCDKTLNLNSKIKTPLGEGIVDNAKLNLYDCTLELSLLYEDAYNTQAACLRPSTFKFVSRDESTFTFNTQYTTSPQSSVIEVTYPSGDVQEFSIAVDTSGNSDFVVPNPIPGTFKFRKKTKCGSVFSDWTDYTTAVYTAPPAVTCSDITGTLSANDTGEYGQHIDPYNTSQFALVYDNAAGDLDNTFEVEVSNPVMVGNPFNGYFLNGYNTYTKSPTYVRTVGNKKYFWVDVFNAVIANSQVHKGPWKFRIRKVCAPGVYSNYTDYLIVKVN